MLFKLNNVVPHQPVAGRYRKVYGVRGLSLQRILNQVDPTYQCFKGYVFTRGDIIFIRSDGYLGQVWLLNIPNKHLERYIHYCGCLIDGLQVLGLEQRLHILFSDAHLPGELTFAHSYPFQ